MMERVRIDEDRIAAVATAIRGRGFAPFAFVEPAENYPPVGHPRALEYFCAVTLHQYGFWNLDGDKWAGSNYGVIDGVRLKGSDFVWRSANKALLAERESLTEFLSDDGTSPLAMAETHRELSRRYAEYVRSDPPSAFLARANAAPDPVKTLLDILGKVPGYAEDPMRKKATLCAMTLAQRPEKFLHVPLNAEKSFGPVVDYHVQRTSLRTGIVVPSDPALRNRLIARTLLEADEEDEIRAATFHAMDELSSLSGVSHPALDLLFFQARRVCPEVETPRCAECPLDKACAKVKELFQPVFRTTAY